MQRQAGVITPSVGRGRGRTSVRVEVLEVVGADKIRNNNDMHLFEVLGLSSVELASAGVSISIFNIVSKLFNIPLLSVATFVAEDIAKNDINDSSGGFLMGRTLAVLMTMTLGTSMVAHQGSNAMAAHQICMQVRLAVSLLSDSLAASGKALVASYSSRGDFKTVKEITNFVLKIGVFTSVFLAVILGLSFGSLATVFTKDVKVLDIVTRCGCYIVYIFAICSSSLWSSWGLVRYLLRRSALELFMVNRSNFFFDFGSTEGRRNAYLAIVQARPPHLNNIYLATQYPVFPWILSDYSSKSLDLANPLTEIFQR
ncbi:hypothetical protein LWI29_029354 [Acer saccharum]|uniref:Uncharacterized protein n=1 Tax=Acer saccharum TaxID=4024 RepID=A0AA39S0V9_ACESA|nr:hypothetical protein LWI29_029354 [Acer saccharum]